RNRKNILILFHDHDAADNFAFAVEVHRASALIVSDLDVTDISQVNRLPFLVASKKEIFQLVDIVVADPTSQLIIAIGHLDHPAAGFLKNFLNGANHLFDRNAGIRQQRWKDFELVLFFETADRSDFSDTGNGLESRLDATFVQQAQLAHVVRTLVIDD